MESRPRTFGVMWSSMRRRVAVWTIDFYRQSFFRLSMPGDCDRCSGALHVA